jgi:hypothetical protein
VPRFLPSWLLLSVALAVVLWSIATLLDNRLQVPEPVPPGAELAGDAGVDAGRSPATDDRHTGGAEEMSCQESEDRLKLVIEDARSCNVDDDCTLFDYGYPLDCMTSVAKEQIPRLREEYRVYGEACEHRVFYDCPTEPYVRLALCRNNRCIVELDKRDDLEDATLDQLNRGRVP